MSPYYPQRNDAVDQWIKLYRDLHDSGTREWSLLDDLLDDYRLLADTGKPLPGPTLAPQTVSDHPYAG